MNIKRLTFSALFAVLIGMTVTAMTSCSNQSKGHNPSSEHTSLRPKDKGGKPGGPQLGSVPNGGSVIDKSGDKTLQAMIKVAVPEFKQFEYTDQETGKTIKYNIHNQITPVPHSFIPNGIYHRTTNKISHLAHC